MMKTRLLAYILTLLALAGAGAPLHAQTFTQVQWGINRGVVPATVCVLGAGGTCLGDVSFTFTAIQIGPAQTPVNQIAQFTTSYTAPQLNATSDFVRIQVGSITPSMEVGTGTNPSTSALSVSLEIPAGSYSGADTWPDAALSLYSLNHNTKKFGLGLYVLSGVAAAGSLAEGINVSTVNCALMATSCTGTTGLDFRFLTTLESDTNVYSNGGIAPTGIVKGVQAIINATIRSTGGMNAFEADAVPGRIPWDCAFCTNGGAALVGLSFGPIGTTGPSDSQGINLTALSGASSSLLAQIFEDSAGAININAPLNGGATWQLSSTYPNVQVLHANAGGPSGMKLRNGATGASVTSNLVFETGTANSNATLQMTDNAGFSIFTGLGAITLQPTTTINLNGGTIIQSLSGYLKGNGASPITASASVPLSDLATQAANTIVGNATAGSAAPTALAIGSCSSASSALIWTTNSGFGCNSSITAGSAAAGSLTGTTLASNVVASSLTSVAILTGGATGAGFTVALGTSTVSGTLPLANTAALSGDVTKAAGNNNTVLATAQPAVHTWALAQTFTVAPIFTDQSGSRTALGLGTAATVNTGTSGGTIPLNNAANTFSALETFSAGTASTVSLATAPTIDASGQTAVTVTNGGSSVIAFDNMGFVIVTDTSTGHTGFYLLTSGLASLIAMDSSWTTSTSPAAGFSSIAWSGVNFFIYNNTGGNHQYKLVNFRTH